MSVSGLAEGVLAGFNTMDRYERGKKMDERAERDQTMREALMANQQEQQKLNNQRYDSEVAYRKERDSLQDARQNKLDSLNEMQLKASIANSQASNARAARSEARQAEMYEWEKKWKQDQIARQESLPIIQAGLSSLSRGEKPSQAYFDEIEKPHNASIHPKVFMNGDLAKAGAFFVNNSRALLNDARSGKLDWETADGVKRINTPEYIDATSRIYADEIKTGIGDMDQATGRRITGKKLHNISVVNSGSGVVFGVEVTYDDGSTAVKPLTEGRSSRADDMVKVMPLSEFLDSGYKRAVMAKEFTTHADEYKALLGMSSGPDMKGYRKAVADLRADTQARLYKIETDSNITDAKERDRLMEAERLREKTAISELGPVFGVSQPSAAVGGGGNGGGSTLSSWVGADPNKQQFIKALATKGKSVPDGLTSEQYEQAYQGWAAEVKADEMLRDARGSKGGLKEAVSMSAPSSVPVSGGLGDAVRGSAYQSGFSSNWRNPPVR
ncbi:hypothetical protein OQ486_09405 [Plesiomonas shigelloides]|uniref:hypothetical protein n=1 Tax=Plesiomonas shigelloides TaxID=703 RepID=UPI002246F6FC|nr:hypothetical protein [Plesiomonas shigelloides]MCX2533692.1 hypothetical protein [Plesiomonas shigelloides]